MSWIIVSRFGALGAFRALAYGTSMLGVRCINSVKSANWVSPDDGGPHGESLVPRITGRNGPNWSALQRACGGGKIPNGPGCGLNMSGGWPVRRCNVVPDAERTVRGSGF